MKPIAFIAIALTALLSACSIHETKTVSPAPAPAAVVSDAPATTTTSARIGF